MAKKSAELKVTRAVDVPHKLPAGAALREALKVDEKAGVNSKLQENSSLL